MELITRQQFYLDIIEEVEHLAQRADPETAERWHKALDQTIKNLLRHPLLGRQRSDLGAGWDPFLARKWFWAMA